LPIAVLAGTDVYNIHTDQLNTPRLLTAAVDGTVAWSWDPEPFGNTQPSGTLTFNHRFPGQYYDRETGLHHNGFRDLHPPSGRYIESDPVGLAAGLNTYAYVRNNPLIHADPTGKVPVLLTWVVACAADPLCWGPIVITASAIINNICASTPHDPERKAFNDLINSLTNGGRKPLTDADAGAALDLARGLGIPGLEDHRDEGAHWKGGNEQPHIHIPATGAGTHIPVEPQPTSETEAADE
jgi:RHS repeat-associated protein